jgi:hypothetical protein
VRAALAAGERVEHDVDGDRIVTWQLSPLAEADGVVGSWATGTVRSSP